MVAANRISQRLAHSSTRRNAGGLIFRVRDGYGRQPRRCGRLYNFSGGHTYKRSYLETRTTRTQSGRSLAQHRRPQDTTRFGPPFRSADPPTMIGSIGEILGFRYEPGGYRTQLVAHSNRPLKTISSSGFRPLGSSRSLRSSGNVSGSARSPTATIASASNSSSGTPRVS